MGKTKAGRKRKAGNREPSGRAQRAPVRTVEEDAMQVAKEARQRVFGVLEDDCTQPEAGTAVGRLLLKGAISRDHYDAAIAFQETYATFLRAIDAPPSSPKAVNIGGASGPSPPDMSPERAKQARERWKEVCWALSVANVAFPENVLYLACDRILLRDVDQPELHGDLRLGLNALVRHYGLSAREAA